MNHLKQQLLYMLLLSALISACTTVVDDWQPAESPLFSRWADQIDPDAPWPEYPRPQMVRPEWRSLNGLWEYAILPIDSARPESWDGKILVPYPVESALSGVKKRVSADEVLWYRTSFQYPGKWRKKRVFLNFEAVDWETTVYIDGREAGFHRGGYDPFEIDITDFVDDGRDHELLVKVWDPGSEGYQPRGKQVNEPGGIWYTPVTGIWQSVWLEPRQHNHITSLELIPDIDAKKVYITTHISGPDTGEIQLEIYQGPKKIAAVRGPVEKVVSVPVPDPILWKPGNPYLYDLKIRYYIDNKEFDLIDSYFGMRKIALGKDEQGFARMELNDEPIFQLGPLDQGYWPDGLYTPPTEEAMIYDLEMTWAMGFNMLRKHVKVENRRFYYWCDKLGLLVWQDMPNGDKHIWGDRPDIDRSAESASQYFYELRQMIKTLYNHPSIVVWVPFNEGWGQFQTGDVTDFVKETDPSRLVNSASGWTDRGTGDIKDIHHYPTPRSPEPETGRAIVLGEFGGLGLPVKGHTWQEENWGYQTFKDSLELLAAYEQYMNELHRLKEEKGLSAAVYTQTTDVETETNGLLTYDRRINKMGCNPVALANQGYTPPVPENTGKLFIDHFEARFSCFRPGALIRYTLDGTEPTLKSLLLEGPLQLEETTTVSLKAWWADSLASRTVRYLFTKVSAEKALDVNPKKGIQRYHYTGSWDALPSFDELRPAKEEVTGQLSYENRLPSQHVGLVFQGYLRIPETGVYQIRLRSDDGSRLYINNRMLIDNDGIHGMRTASAEAPLKAGFHKMRLEYFQNEGGRGLEVLIQLPNGQEMEIPSDWLYH